MTTLEIVIIAVAVVLLLLALGGARVLRRRHAAGAEGFRERLDRADRDLAAAHAADNGWEPARVEEAAREAFASQHPGVEVVTMELVQVVDPPGTDEDRAVFRVEAGEHAHRLTLGRHGDDWHFEKLEEAPPL